MYISNIWIGTFLLFMQCFGISDSIKRFGQKVVIAYCFSLQARNIILHENDEEDVITGLKQKTNFGRPNWDEIFRTTAQKHKG